MNENVRDWTHVQAGLQAVQARVSEAAQRAGRAAGDITLLAVSKTFPAGAIRAAMDAGQRDFGESYLQEAREKQQILYGFDLVWHFIGPIQSNKTREIATGFDWAHGVSREKIARRLSEQRPAGMPPLNVCIQVNVSGETSKSGVAPAEVESLAAEVYSLPGLRLRGLMCIPEADADPRNAFAAMRGLLQQLCAKGYALDTLSMGMSGDFETAIEEGATIIRVGSAIFGQRHYPV